MGASRDHVNNPFHQIFSEIINGTSQFGNFGGASIRNKLIHSFRTKIKSCNLIKKLLYNIYDLSLVFIIEFEESK